MKIGIAQINTTVGDFYGNSQKILQSYETLCRQGAEVVVFPELVLCGYSPRDLLFKKRFVHDNDMALRALAAKIGEVPAIIGCVRKISGKKGLFNSVAWCVDGKVQQFADKCLLPSYDVFDEKRHFTPAKEPTMVEYKGKRIGLTICEDIWTAKFSVEHYEYHIDPVALLANTDVDFIFNFSASPWFFGKHELRRKVAQACAKRTKAPVIYCNLVGANDQVVFDGRSFVTNKKGEVIASMEPFVEELQVVDTSGKPIKLTEPSEMQETHDALVLGLRDYAHKSGFQRAVIGLSGGIDSAVVAVLAVEALGKENVMGVSLPSSISSEHSKTDAQELALNLGIEFHTIPIQKIVSATEDVLKPLFKKRPRDTAEENMQARSRGMVLMSISNKFNAILLSTGNKSELAVGYCTLYGDMAGGLAVISDVPKMKVYQLAKFMNRKKVLIPKNTISKAPSAELAPDQLDQDTLPPYPVLDEILRLYIEERKSSLEIIAKGFDEIVVRDIVRRVDINEYKRKQSALGLKISPLAFGVGRRMPIVQKYVS
ncbi:MAG: NAD+ synthase [Verrucomicrobia bacterium CG_4_10_14_3_um_filter_43_23]|nr:MAG: NAD+ synthase [Verrucomicrobia bacterium CG1_02_43_26]PIP58725.1 MAG: NAD+ synthase [Verrucomicrobia bacterium CG22_combo_CG10-13_8_21_14_all_43_17]PIX58739.1 MAG: NAD+ synthase [Verrucomicrobia bacterium CG_4_10_14_3_um_filter_43_23]PIY62949.1 MAG: NAD+ synthase [Verrucomicrobia bacterium CG_4_10_14_0_8_um_filter_43_34]PJA43918.1 MAG: NAD+ synthase [Verrucomicrobia bacterium CG_4_9_14_3_um_filter_43_20]